MIDRIRGIFTIVQFTITVSIVIILMYLFNSSNRVFRRIWAQFQVKMLGVEIVEYGEIDNDADMLMMNHQSILDIIVIESIGKRDIAWVAKKEIADLPWFGRILDAPKMIIVQRESKKSLVQLLKDSKDRLDNDRQIAIFPEGTRSYDNKMRKFKAGSKMIAEKYNLKVQGLIILGTHELFDSKGIKQKPGRVDVIYLPTIQAEKGTDWYEQLELQMNETFNEYLAKRQK